MVTGRGRKKSYLFPCLTDDQLDRRKVISGLGTQHSTLFIFASVGICGVTCPNNGPSTSFMTLDIGDAHVIEAP